jgi:ABC-type dipeptide/oligopeptide/nickel transport system permease subunit
MTKPMVELEQPAERGFWTQLRRLPRAWVGAGMVFVVALAAILAPVLSPADPLKQFREGLSQTGTPLPPGGQFPLGSDNLGRDVLSRMLYGAQVSLTVSFIANLTAAVLGTTLGLWAGYYSGPIDWAIMRLVDILLAFPAILLALGLGAVLRPSFQTVTIILAVVTFPALVRLVRSQVLSIRERTFVESARALGATDWHIIFRHILPHTITVTVVWASLSFANTVLVESALSFLGVGIPLPAASWGNMINEGQSRYRIAPWMIIVPTVAILITTLGFNLLGDAVRDALDPRTAQRQKS